MTAVRQMTAIGAIRAIIDSGRRAPEQSGGGVSISIEEKEVSICAAVEF